jgi:hypothetical protein
VSATADLKLMSFLNINLSVCLVFNTEHSPNDQHIRSKEQQHTIQNDCDYQKPIITKVLPNNEICKVSHGRNQFTKNELFLTVRMKQQSSTIWSFDK